MLPVLVYPNTEYFCCEPVMGISRFAGAVWAPLPRQLHVASHAFTANFQQVCAGVQALRRRWRRLCARWAPRWAACRGR